MKPILIALVMAASTPGPFIIQAPGGVFVIHPETARAYQNTRGFLQVEMVVDMSTADSVTRHRVGVSGCPDGRGQIARVGDDGNPLTEPATWSTSGSRVNDVMAAAICSIIKPTATPALPNSGMV